MNPLSSTGLREQFRLGAEEFGIELDADLLAKFERFGEFLDQTNKHLNLTRVPLEDFPTLHYLDSLSVVAVLRPEPGDTLIDVGTGAGFPGIPLALVFPELQVTLLDGTRKKLDFIDSVLTELGIANAVTLHGRAEEVANHSLYRGRFHFATARAVAKLSQLAAWMIPLVRKGGAAIAYKSNGSDAEVDNARPAIDRLGGHIERIAHVGLPHSEIVRNIIVIRNGAAEAVKLETGHRRG